MKCEQVLHLDVTNVNTYQYVYAKQGDKNSRVLKVLLFNQGTRVLPAVTDQITLRCIKPDQKSCIITGSVDDTGIISVELTDQCLAVPGSVRADITVQSGESVISSVTFFIQVSPIPLNSNQATSTNEFLSLIETLEAAKSATDSATKAAQSANSATSAATEAASKAEQAASQAESATNAAISSANAATTAAKSATNSAVKTADGVREDMDKVLEAESGRETAEANRAAAESARVEAETARVDAEADRAAAEKERQTAESARIAAEDDRQSAETSRARVETARESAETDRVAAEAARVNAEAERTDDERLRKDHESQRVTDETARQTAESKRQEAETARADAESKRADAEQARVKAESTRVAAETTRKDAESKRDNAEQERQTAEKGRVAAEAKRTEDFAKIKESLDEIPKIDDTAITTTSPWSSKQIVDTLCPPIEETGNPVVCYPVAGYPLDVTVNWGPTQEGSGTPSPENIRPIKGRDIVTITRQEDNQVITLPLSETVYGGEVDAVSGEGRETWETINLPKTGWVKDNSATFTRFNNYTALAAPASSKEQFKNILCDTLPSKNTADDDTAIQLESANATMLRVSVSGIKTLDDFLSFLDAYSVQVCYKLAEPVPFTAIGAQPLLALAGANTVLTDADSVSVSGRADLIHIIKKTQEK